MLTSKSAGFITEVDSASTGPTRTMVSEENVISELAKDYSSYMLSSLRRTQVFRRDLAKETQLNNLTSQVRRKQETLRQLTDNLAQLHEEQRRTVPGPLKQARERLKTATDAECDEEATTESYQFVLARTQATVLKSEDRMKAMRREVRIYSEMLEEGRKQQRAFLVEQQHDDLQLRELRDQLQRLRSERESYRGVKIQQLQTRHREVDTEWSEAKRDKAKSLVTQRNIEWLHEWLGRQREIRKVLRLHMGMEELAKHRFDDIIQQVIDSLGGNDVDEALANYQQTVAKNQSLLQEAEYKLSLQALYERKLAALFTELRWITDQLAKASPKDYRLRLAKSEIHFSHTTTRMKAAEAGYRRAVQAKETNKQTVIEAVSQCTTLLDLLGALDVWVETAAPVVISFGEPAEVVKAFLVLEKRLSFLQTVTYQRRRHFPPNSDSLFQLFQSTPRIRELPPPAKPSKQGPDSSSDSPLERQRLPEVLPSSALARTSRHQFPKEVTVRRNLQNPKEFFSARMRIYKDFLSVRSAFFASPKAISPIPELLFSLRQSERKILCFTQPSPNNKSLTDRQRTLLATARSYLSTRSDSHTAGSPSNLPHK